MEHLHVDAHPVRVQLEKKVGRQLMEYVFGENGRTKKHTSDQNTSKYPQGTSHAGTGEAFNATHDGRRHTKTSRDRRNYGPSLSRQNSSSEVPAMDPEQKDVRRKKSGSSLVGDEQPFLPFEADEMHSRATKNITFVSVSFVQTTLVLSYKVGRGVIGSPYHNLLTKVGLSLQGDKPKSITDLYDFKFTCPELRYTNKTWSFEDLFRHMRRGKRQALTKKLPNADRQNVVYLSHRHHSLRLATKRRFDPGSVQEKPKANQGYGARRHAQRTNQAEDDNTTL
jgi:hypothetical protein